MVSLAWVGNLTTLSNKKSTKGVSKVQGHGNWKREEIGRVPGGSATRGVPIKKRGR